MRNDVGLNRAVNPPCCLPGRELALVNKSRIPQAVCPHFVLMDAKAVSYAINYMPIRGP